MGSMSNHRTQLKTSKPKSKTKRVSHPISKDLSLPVNNWKMAEHWPTTTSKKNPLSTWCSDSEVECKSSSRPCPARPSLSMSNHRTQLKTSKQKSKTKRVSHPISKDSFSPENNWKMAEHWPTTTSRKSPLSTWCSDSEVETKFPLLEKAIRYT